MKNWLWLLAAVIAVYVVVTMMTRERFQPEFLDRSQIDRTISTENSSYRQQTNHMNPAPYRMDPVSGVETPFQINQWKAYVPV
jgi:hypothetical protein